MTEYTVLGVVQWPQCQCARVIWDSAKQLNCLTSSVGKNICLEHSVVYGFNIPVVPKLNALGMGIVFHLRGGIL